MWPGNQYTVRHLHFCLVSLKVQVMNLISVGDKLNDWLRTPPSTSIGKMKSCIIAENSVWDGVY